MTLQTHPSTTAALVEEIEGLNASLMLAWGDADEAQRIEGALDSRRSELKAAASRMLGCDVKRAAVAMGGFV